MIKIGRHTLDNGLRILHYHDASTQMVALNLLFDVGSRDESPAHTGLAHLIEHLMFTGTANVENFDIPLQAAGGESNAWTSSDVTNFYETLPAHNVETAFWLESDRLRNLALSARNIATQKSVVIEEFKQRCLNQPYGDLMHRLHALVYQVHPYRWPTIGLSTQDIADFPAEVITGFFHDYYHVNNAILCVSGNITLERTVELAQKWFGSFARHQVPQRCLPAEPPVEQPRLDAVRNTAVPQDVLVMAYPMVGRNHPDYQACDMVSDVLANGTSSRFYRNVLLGGKGLFTHLDASVTGTIDPGFLMIEGRLAQGVTHDQARAVIAEQIDRLTTDGISAHEVEKCANKWESTQLFENVSYAEKAARLCYCELLGDANKINTEIDAYRAITAEGITGLARRLFDPRRCCELRYGPNA